MECRFHKWFQIEPDDFLRNAVRNRWNAQRPLAPIRLGDHRPAYRRWHLAARGHPVPKLVKVRAKPFPEAFERLPIHTSCTLVRVHVLERFPDISLLNRKRLCLCHPAHPVTSWPVAAAEHHSPFGPAPLQHLRPYYELFCPCAPHRYSGPFGGFPIGRLPWHRDDRFSCSAKEPDPDSRRLRAGCRMGRASGHRPYSSRGDHHPRF